MILLNSSGLMKPSWSLSKYLNACRRRSPCNPFMSWVNSLSSQKWESLSKRMARITTYNPRRVSHFFSLGIISSNRWGVVIYLAERLYQFEINSPVEIEWDCFRSKISRKDSLELVKVDETRVIAGTRKIKFRFHYDVITITHTSKYWKAIQ